MALQCPATLHLARLDDCDGDQARALARSLRDERVAVVVSDSSSPVLAGAQLAARCLEAPHETHAGLGAGDLGEVLTDIADRFRGEHVLVLGPLAGPDVIGLATRVPDGARARPHLPSGCAARLEIGDDGIALLSWPGETTP